MQHCHTTPLTLYNSFVIIHAMRKKVVQMPEALAFSESLPKLSARKYHAYLAILEEDGVLRAPFAEKIVGEQNLFALRIMTAGNERFFYCYDDGEIIYVLNSYAKKTAKIPLRELNKAKSIKAMIGGLK